MQMQEKKSLVFSKSQFSYILIIHIAIFDQGLVYWKRGAQTSYKYSREVMPPSWPTPIPQFFSALLLKKKGRGRRGYMLTKQYILMWRLKAKKDNSNNKGMLLFPNQKVVK